MAIRLTSFASNFLQVQAQINIAEVAYCDFTVWPESGIHIERIIADNEFGESTVSKATSFFKNGILPELLGKWFTKSAL